MLDKLSSKVTEMIHQYGVFKEENEHLRNELMTLKAERGIKDQEIARLVQENAHKDMEIEEIVNKIESMLG
jgi:FtsZ-binding cell division protein ZapB